MPTSCSAFGCTNRVGQSTVQFFRFPLKNAALMERWMQAIKRKGFIPSTSSRLCSTHFKESEFQIRPNMKRLLKHDAVPSIFDFNYEPICMSYPSYLHNKKPRKVLADITSVTLNTNSLVFQSEPTSGSNATVTSANLNVETHGKDNESSYSLMSEPTSSSNLTVASTISNNETHDEDDESLLMSEPNPSSNLTVTSTISNVETHSDDNESNYSLLVGDISAPANENIITQRERVFPSSSTSLDINSFVNTPHSSVLRQKKRPSRDVAWFKKEIRRLHQEVRRKNKKIANLKSLIIEQRKEKKNVMEKQFDEKIGKFGVVAAELFRNESVNCGKIKGGHRYTPEIKEFSLTMHYYSPKAYDFCRTIFTLPHPTAITHWTSSVDARPGFFRNVLSMAKKFQGDDLYCNLIFDGIAIKQKLLWDVKSQKMLGICNFGDEVATEIDPEKPAVEALVFMLVSLSGKWRWPIGYFLQCKSPSVIQCELVQKAITLCSEAGLKVLNVTCDGTTTNLSTFQHLGCSVACTLDEMNTTFLHPATGDTVNCMLDPSHIIKLARGCFATYKRIKSPTGIINWKYITYLHELQDDIGLKFANKLGKKHIEWKQNCMKVKLASQVLSSSVANAMEFLREAGVEKFKDCKATVEFIRRVDGLFDFLNSRNPFGKGFKIPIFPHNIDFLERRAMASVRYLYSLKDMEDTYLWKGARKAFVIGFASAVQSSLKVARYLFANNPSQRYILTHKLSQDHLESFFSRIRKRLGHNNNPDVKEFETAMKRILLRNNISASKNGNCTPMTAEAQGNVFDFKWRKKTVENETVDIEATTEDDEELFENINMLDCDSDTTRSLYWMKDNILYYISGYVVRKIYKKIKCPTCAENLIAAITDHNYSHDTLSKFFDLKNNGGLIRPSKDVVKIIKNAETLFTLEERKCGKLAMEGATLLRKLVRQAVTKSVMWDNVFHSTGVCADQGFTDRNHKIDLVAEIVQDYYRLRLHAYVKREQDDKNKFVNQRQKLTKLTLNLHQ